MQKALRPIQAALELHSSEYGDALLWGASDELQAFAEWRAGTLRLVQHSAAKGGGEGLKSSTKRKSKGSAKKRALTLTAAIDAWCEAAVAANPSLSFALESLTWAYALPAIAQQADSDSWWRLAEQLDAIAVVYSTSRPGEEASVDDLLLNQLLAGELALVLSSVLPHARPWRALGKLATDTLTEGVLAWTDGEGIPPGRGLPRLGLLAGLWTRCRRLSYQTGVRCWDAAAQTQYEWLVRQLVRLADREGALPLSRPPITKGAGLIRAALDCAGDEADLAAATQRLSSKSNPSPPHPIDTPDASINSEWSGVSLLSGGWGKKDSRLLITYDELDNQLSLANLGTTLLTGEWRTSVVINGVAVAMDGPWEEQCWFSDHDCDFLELSVDLEFGGRLERMILLAKQDAAAMLIDIVHAGQISSVEEPVTIEVETRLPLAEDVFFEPATETREGWLRNNKRQLAGVMPLAMAEWRSEPRCGEILPQEKSVVLTHQAVGSAIACPVWFDLKPKRFAKQRTWRQLTIAESLAPVDSDVAVGYRVQSGKDQWLIYRSLAQRANRTVLGQNYSSESFIGRFNPKTGQAEEYFEVEG